MKVIKEAIMNTLCYIEGNYRIEKINVVAGHVFELRLGSMPVKAYDTFGAALDAIDRIEGPETWDGCDGLNCQQGCTTCYPV